VQYDVVVPDFGGISGQIVIEEWLKRPGDSVRAGEALLRASTDKASVEIEAFRDGILHAIVAEVGTTIEAGAVIALISDPEEAPRDERPVGAPPTVRTVASAIAPGPQRVDPIRPSLTSCATDAADTSPLFVSQLRDMFRRMVLIRRFEDHLYHLFLQGLVPGTLHQYQGQEAVAVGVCAALRTDDVIFSTHRPVGHLIAKGAALRPIAAELWGKATGCAGGKGGQMHLIDMEVGAFTSNAIVGANVPITAGAAIGFQLRGLDRVAVSFFGDGAANIGALHEGINLAAVKDAPAIFICENNLYAASTHVALASRVESIASRAAGYGIPGITVDGMDVEAVYGAAREAVARARRGGGPTLLECLTYRYSGHSRGDPGGYRTGDEVQFWRQRDPIPRCREALITRHSLAAEALTRIEQECQEQVEDAVSFARYSPEPDATACYTNVYRAGGAPPWLSA
jgi:pyruvate dehydrogenase E1 component alpha subunit